MEILFENRFMINKDRYLEWAKKPIKRSILVTLRPIILVFVVIIFIVSFINLDMNISGMYLLLTIWYLYLTFFQTRITVTRQLKSIKSIQGKEEWERVIQISDCITINDINSTTKYEWTQVVKLLDVKDYLVLMLSDKIGIRLKKDGFTIGTPDAFIQFIKDKYTSVTIEVR